MQNFYLTLVVPRIFGERLEMVIEFHIFRNINLILHSVYKLKIMKSILAETTMENSQQLQMVHLKYLRI